MATTRQREHQEELDKLQREAWDKLIGEQVMHVLGEPANLLMMQVRRLWGNHYRVNVITGHDHASARVAHSYFLATDGEGRIVASSPKIAKAY